MKELTQAVETVLSGAAVIFFGLTVVLTLVLALMAWLAAKVQE